MRCRYSWVSPAFKEFSYFSLMTAHSFYSNCNFLSRLALFHFLSHILMLRLEIAKSLDKLSWQAMACLPLSRHLRIILLLILFIIFSDSDNKILPQRVSLSWSFQYCEFYSFISKTHLFSDLLVALKLACFAIPSSMLKEFEIWEFLLNWQTNLNPRASIPIIFLLTMVEKEIKSYDSLNNLIISVKCLF